MENKPRRRGNRDIRNILAVIIVLAAIALTYLFMVKEIPEDNRDIVMVIAGSIYGGAMQTIISYYFGSTKSEVDRRSTAREKEIDKNL